MRLITTFHDERMGLAFYSFLKEKGILCQLEVKTNQDWGSADYGTYNVDLWIEDEDQIDEAAKWLRLFQAHPEDPIFHFEYSPQPPHASPPANGTASPQQQQPSSGAATSRPIPWGRQTMGIATRVLLLTCVFLLLVTQLWISPNRIPEKYVSLSIFTSPVERALLYDYPKFYELIDRFIHIYGYEGLEAPQELPSEGQQLIQQINHTPYWQGIYHLFIKEGQYYSEAGYPRFEKIKEGQVWRLFTPCLLHGNIFHLFFNMLWLIVLGKQMEARLGPGRYILFILIAGVLSNTAQYLMSGPNFIGFSGVLCGMLAFIWVRQKQAAWEGYQVDRVTLIFMLIYILSLALLQFVSFFLEKSSHLPFSLNIANTAHVTGGIAGYCLGRLHFFSWRHT